MCISSAWAFDCWTERTGKTCSLCINFVSLLTKLLEQKVFYVNYNCFYLARCPWVQVGDCFIFFGQTHLWCGWTWLVEAVPECQTAACHPAGTCHRCCLERHYHHPTTLVSLGSNHLPEPWDCHHWLVTPWSSLYLCRNKWSFINSYA